MFVFVSMYHCSILGIYPFLTHCHMRSNGGGEGLQGTLPLILRLCPLFTMLGVLRLSGVNFVNGPNFWAEFRTSAPQLVKGPPDPEMGGDTWLAPFDVAICSMLEFGDKTRLKQRPPLFFCLGGGSNTSLACRGWNGFDNLWFLVFAQIRSIRPGKVRILAGSLPTILGEWVILSVSAAPYFLWFFWLGVELERLPVLTLVYLYAPPGLCVYILPPDFNGFTHGGDFWGECVSGYPELPHLTNQFSRSNYFDQSVTFTMNSSLLRGPITLASFRFLIKRRAMHQVRACGAMAARSGVASGRLCSNPISACSATHPESSI